MTLRAFLLVTLSVGWWRVGAACAAADRVSRRHLLRASVVVVFVATLLALVSGPLLGWLDVDTETFRIAVGLVLVAAGLARVVGWGAAPDPDLGSEHSWVWPLAYPVLFGPETAMMALSAGSDYGVAFVAAATAAAGVLMAVVAGISNSMRARASKLVRLITDLVRVAGVALIVLGVALVFDGIRDI